MTWRFITLLVMLINFPKSQGANCSNSGNRTVIHLRSMMTRESEAIARRSGDVGEIAANHINGMSGLLDDYYICFRSDVVLVSIQTIVAF